MFSSCNPHRCTTLSKRYTFFQELCQPLYCPYHSNVRNHTCYNKRFSARRLVYEFSVLVSAIETTETAFASSFYYNIATNVQNVVSRTFASFDSMKDCKLFDSSAMLEADGSNEERVYVFTFRVSGHNGQCGDNILSDFRFNSVQKLDIVLRTETFRVMVRLSQQIKGTFTDRYELYSFTRELIDRVVVKAPVLNCPYVILSADQFCKLYELKLNKACPSVTTNHSFDTFVVVFSLVDNSYYICANEYMRETFDFTSPITPSSTAASFVASLYVLLYIFMPITCRIIP